LWEAKQELVKRNVDGVNKDVVTDDNLLDEVDVDGISTGHGESTPLQPWGVDTFLLQDIAVSEVNTVVEATVNFTTNTVDNCTHATDDCDSDIENIEVLKQAIDELDSLSKRDITAMKSIWDPSGLVERIAEAVCLLLKKEPTWGEFQKLAKEKKGMY
jgi:hypothetical protein